MTNWFKFQRISHIYSCSNRTQTVRNIHQQACFERKPWNEFQVLGNPVCTFLKTGLHIPVSWFLHNIVNWNQSNESTWFYNKYRTTWQKPKSSLLETKISIENSNIECLTLVHTFLFWMNNYFSLILLIAWIITDNDSWNWMHFVPWFNRVCGVI